MQYGNPQSFILAAEVSETTQGIVKNCEEMKNAAAVEAAANWFCEYLLLRLRRLTDIR